eukprot:TRINITY_DN177_c0_g2_i1.p1 TRINITY_DN177_c0_g2~~TRINITY_DN177_c0_g2_i1.p1  ORF type:complete len:1411 (-),score=345.75 TRINITY_DN177_c0_g2_i1:13-4245(-)
MGAKQSSGNLQLAGEDYIRHGCIGTGGFSQVFAVEHSNTGTLRAISRVKKAKLLTQKKWGMQGTLHSLQVTKVLRDSPYTLPVYAAFQDESFLYMLMKLCDGGELRSQMVEDGYRVRMAEATIRSCLAEVVIAVEGMHSRGVVHRDLKPENILVDSNGRICVADFGLSVLTDEDSWLYLPNKKRMVVGTLAFIAPELLRRLPHTEKVDWWAVGMIAYKMANARFPWKIPSRSECDHFLDACNRYLHNQRSEDIVHIDDVSPDFVDLVGHMLEPDPSSRWGPTEIKAHPFFADVDWDDVLNCCDVPPFEPSVNLGKLMEGKEFDDDADDSDLLVSERHQNLFMEWDHIDEELNDMLDLASSASEVREEILYLLENTTYEPAIKIYPNRERLGAARYMTHLSDVPLAKHEGLYWTEAGTKLERLASKFIKVGNRSKNLPVKSLDRDSDYISSSSKREVKAEVNKPVDPDNKMRFEQQPAHVTPSQLKKILGDAPVGSTVKTKGTPREERHSRLQRFFGDANPPEKDVPAKKRRNKNGKKRHRNISLDFTHTPREKEEPRTVTQAAQPITVKKSRLAKFYGLEPKVGSGQLQVPVTPSMAEFYGASQLLGLIDLVAAELRKEVKQLSRKSGANEEYEVLQRRMEKNVKRKFDKIHAVVTRELLENSFVSRVAYQYLVDAMRATVAAEREDFLRSVQAEEDFSSLVSKFHKVNSKALVVESWKNGEKISPNSLESGDNGSYSDSEESEVEETLVASPELKRTLEGRGRDRREKEKEREKEKDASLPRTEEKRDRKDSEREKQREKEKENEKEKEKEKELEIEIGNLSPARTRKKTTLGKRSERKEKEEKEREKLREKAKPREKEREEREREKERRLREQQAANEEDGTEEVRVSNAPSDEVSEKEEAEGTVKAVVEKEKRSSRRIRSGEGVVGRKGEAREDLNAGDGDTKGEDRGDLQSKRLSTSPVQTRDHSASGHPESDEEPSSPFLTVSSPSSPPKSRKGGGRGVVSPQIFASAAEEDEEASLLLPRVSPSRDRAMGGVGGDGEVEDDEVGEFDVVGGKEPRDTVSESELSEKDYISNFDPDEVSLQQSIRTSNVSESEYHSSISLFEDDTNASSEPPPTTVPVETMSTFAKPTNRRVAAVPPPRVARKSFREKLHFRSQSKKTDKFWATKMKNSKNEKKFHSKERISKNARGNGGARSSDYVNVRAFDGSFSIKVAMPNTVHELLGIAGKRMNRKFGFARSDGSPDEVLDLTLIANGDTLILYPRAAIAERTMDPYLARFESTAMSVILVGEKGEIEYANPYCSKLLNMAKSNLVGNSIGWFLTSDYKLADYGTISGLLKQMVLTLETKSGKKIDGRIGSKGWVWRVLVAKPVSDDCYGRRLRMLACGGCCTGSSCLEQVGPPRWEPPLL